MSNFIEPFLLGVSLAMDALAVSLALGAVERRNFTWFKIALTAGSFGIFQMLMPLAGWFGGSLCGALVQTYGRYIACMLLLFLGGKMIYESLKPEEEGDSCRGFQFGRLVVLSFATSIDALLVGVSYACLGRTGIVPDTAIIGIVTAAISAGGCIIGRLCGKIFGSSCEIMGGIVLIGIGIKVLFWG